MFLHSGIIGAVFALICMLLSGIVFIGVICCARKNKHKTISTQVHDGSIPSITTNQNPVNDSHPATNNTQNESNDLSTSTNRNIVLYEDPFDSIQPNVNDAYDCQVNNTGITSTTHRNSVLYGDPSDCIQPNLNHAYGRHVRGSISLPREDQLTIEVPIELNSDLSLVRKNIDLKLVLVRTNS